MTSSTVDLHDLKKKKPHELLEYAEKVGVENPSALKKQNMLFAILKSLAEKNIIIEGGGVLETLQDGFGFLRSPNLIICLGRMIFMLALAKYENSI